MRERVSFEPQASLLGVAPSRQRGLGDKSYQPRDDRYVLYPMCPARCTTYWSSAQHGERLKRRQGLHNRSLGAGGRRALLCRGSG